MLSLTHAAVGGAIGSEINQPAVAFVLGVIIHFVADKIPHFWPEKKNLKVYYMIFDVISTIGILAVLFFNYRSVNWPIFLGALGGGLVDPVILFTPIYKTKVGKWHTNRQPHKTDLKFLATDVVLIIVAVLWLYFRGI